MDIRNLTAAVSRRELLAAGYSPSEIAAAVRRGDLIRLAPGVFAPSISDTRFREQRHHMIAMTTARSAAPQALCRVSAAVVHGMPVWGMDLSAVHLHTNYAGSGTRPSSRSVLHHDLPHTEYVEINGVAATSVARTVVDLAKSQPLGPAVCAGDDALHERLCTSEDIERESAQIAGYRGYRQALRAIRLMDARSESVLESRSRLVIGESDLPCPDLCDQKRAR